MNDALGEFLGFVLASREGVALYGEDHNVVAGMRRRAVDSLRAALGGRPGVRLVVLADNMLHAGSPVPGGPRFAGCFGAWLAEHGIDVIDVGAGLTADDVLRFCRLAAAKAAPGTLQGIAFGSITTDGLGNVDGAGTPGAASAQADISPDLIFSGPGAPGFSEAPDSDASPSGSPVAASGQVARLIAAAQVPDDPIEECLLRSVESIWIVSRSFSGSMAHLAHIRSHDEYTLCHTVNVAILASALGEQVGYSGRRLEALTIAALMHDVGKQRTPPEILNKAGRLSDGELAVIRRHPAEGAAILLDRREVPTLSAVVAYEHHQRLDGKGYPEQRGRRPMLASQIVHIADVFDALRTNRPYRAALPLDEVFRIMSEQAGRAFDAELFAVFMERVVAPAGDNAGAIGAG